MDRAMVANELHMYRLAHLFQPQGWGRAKHLSTQLAGAVACETPYMWDSLHILYNEPCDGKQHRRQTHTCVYIASGCRGACMAV